MQPKADMVPKNGDSTNQKQLPAYARAFRDVFVR